MGKDESNCNGSIFDAPHEALLEQVKTHPSWAADLLKDLNKDNKDLWEERENRIGWQKRAARAEGALGKIIGVAHDGLGEERKRGDAEG